MGKYTSFAVLKETS